MITQEVLTQHVLEHTHVGSPDKVILIGIGSRTGTGSLVTGLGRSPTRPNRHIQPFKALARRQAEQEGVVSCTPLKFTGFATDINLDGGTHLVKETIGINLDNPAEWLDSLDILLRAGVEPQKMAIVATSRAPLDMIASWMRMWGIKNIEGFPFDALQKSFERTQSLVTMASSLHIPVVPYIHEFIRDLDRFDVISRICSIIGLDFHSAVVQWDDRSTDADDNNDWYFDGRIVKYDQPPNAWVEGSLAITHGGRGGVIWQPVPLNDQLTKEEVEFAETQLGEVKEIHNWITQLAISTLGLT